MSGLVGMLTFRIIYPRWARAAFFVAVVIDWTGQLLINAADAVLRWTLKRGRFVS